MKKKFFRSLENLLNNKMVVLPFLGLLAASAVFVWTTAFASPGEKEHGEEESTGGAFGEGSKTSAESRTSPEVKEEGSGIQDDPRQCKAMTKRGTRCQHLADESGYCRQHKALFEQVVAASSRRL